MRDDRKIKIIEGSRADVDEIKDLYVTVATVEGGLARTADEISAEYVEYFVERSILTGILLIARNADDEVVGEMHGYAIGPKVFSHVLGEITIAVHPEHQGVGIGRDLFEGFMGRVANVRADILRVELIARESNQKAIEFYEKLGFVREGRFACRIRSVGGGFEADIPMAWTRS